MLNFLAHILTVTSLHALAQPTTLLTRDTSLGQLYVYGTNISGIPLFFDNTNNSIAYIGNLTNLHDVSGSEATFNYTSSTSILATTSSTTGYLSINTNPGSSASVTLSDTEVSGFYMYGTQLTFLTSDRQMLSNWYAFKTDVVGILALKWIADGSAGEGVGDGVAVVLKTSSADVDA